MRWSFELNEFGREHSLHFTIKVYSFGADPDEFHVARFDTLPTPSEVQQAVEAWYRQDPHHLQMLPNSRVRVWEVSKLLVWKRHHKINDLRMQVRVANDGSLQFKSESLSV